MRTTGDSGVTSTARGWLAPPMITMPSTSTATPSPTSTVTPPMIAQAEISVTWPSNSASRMSRTTPPQKANAVMKLGTLQRPLAVDPLMTAMNFRLVAPAPGDADGAGAGRGARPGVAGAGTGSGSNPGGRFWATASSSR